MKTTIKVCLAVLVISICFAFTSVKNNGLSVTYGVSENNPSQIELELNKDYTFTYQDLSNYSQKIKVSGTYLILNDKIQLTSKEEIKFHDKWNFSNDGKAIKSRKGLTFYALHIK